MTTTQPDESATAQVPTGPVLSSPERLRRNVHDGAMRSDGSPGSSAFNPSTHDGMMSTFRESVTPEDSAARWSGRFPLVGVWPVEVEECASLDLPVYDDADRGCACGGEDGCDSNYPQDHASVDMRHLTRAQRERKAKQIRDLSVKAGELFLSQAPL